MSTHVVEGWMSVDVPGGCRFHGPPGAGGFSINEPGVGAVMIARDCDDRLWDAVLEEMDAPCGMLGGTGTTRLRRGEVTIGAWRGVESLVHAVVERSAEWRPSLPQRALLWFMGVGKVTAALTGGETVHWLLLLENGGRRVHVRVTAMGGRLDEERWRGVMASMTPLVA